MFGALEQAQPPEPAAVETLTGHEVGTTRQPSAILELPTALQAPRPAPLHSAGPSAVAAGGY